MKTTVVCGLLGAGKTTFIQNFLKNSEEKTVVLVNDFGQTGIDGEIFSAGGIEAVELPSGCVCCTLRTDLITTIGKIVKEFSPEHLIIEPSGIASPSGVLEALASLSINRISVVGIVDATEFVELHEAQIYGAFFEDQLINSDVVLVNKADLAEEEKMSATINLIEKINPGAVIFRTVNAVMPGPLPFVSHEGRSAETSGAHFHFDTISLAFKALEFSSFSALVEEMAKGKYGDVARAKALVQTEQGPFRFDLSYGKTDFRPFERPVAESRLVVIGEDLKEDAIRSALLRK